MSSNFEIKNGYRGIIIQKDGTSFSIEKGMDGDIWFNSANKDTKLPINSLSKNSEECQTYVIFENLIKAIADRYVANGDDKDEYSFLPNDFIDLGRKTIIWHSDSDKNNILQLQIEKKKIIISITKDKSFNNINFDNTIKVRVRSSGSDYGVYYQEFERFFGELSSFAHQTVLTKTQQIPNNEAPPKDQPIKILKRK